MDLGLRPDVDSSRRLVHDQHVRVGQQPSSDQHLLLVPSGQVLDRGFHCRGLHPDLIYVRLRVLTHLLRIQRHPVRLQVQVCHHHVLTHAQQPHDPVPAPVFRQQADVVLDRILRAF